MGAQITPPEPIINVRKLSQFVDVSDEVLAEGIRMRELVEASLSGTSTRPPDREARGLPGWFLALQDAAAPSPLLAELVELHIPVWDVVYQHWHCEAEPPSGYDWEWPEWPCETIARLARHLGVEVA